MTEFAPCRQCKRHVAIADDACPFCSTTQERRSSRVVVRGRLARAAVFSAALVACESKPAGTKPEPVEHAGSGSDDLEKMLDVGQRNVERGPTADAAIIDAAVADAALIDAAPPVDAAVPIDAGVKRRPRPDAAVPISVGVPPYDHHNLAKPYGAPPARRRLV